MLLGYVGGIERPANIFNEGSVSLKAIADSPRDPLVVRAFYNYGLNIAFEIGCDLKQHYVDQRLSIADLYSRVIQSKVLNMMKNSQQVNSLEENLQNMIIMTLDGNVNTTQKNLGDIIQELVKTTTFSYDGISEHCVPCSDVNETIYGIC